MNIYVVERDLGAQLDELAPLVPRKANERRSYSGVAWTAGICEEIMFRGYLIWYVSQFTPLPWAVVLSSVAFGVSHSYQGFWPHVLATGSVGLVLALLYVFSGFLWLAMAFHVYLDINQGQLMSGTTGYSAHVGLGGTDQGLVEVVQILR